MDWDAALYDRQHSFVGACGNALVEHVRAFVEARPPGSAPTRILDIGCGTGAHLDALGALGAVTGVDASPAMVERARAGHPHADVRVADACALPFQEAYDVTFSNAVFHWIPDQEALLASVARSLAPGGALVAEMGGQGNNARIHAAMARSLHGLGAGYEVRFRFPSEGEYRRLLADAGFSVELIDSFDRPTPLAGGEAGLRLWAEQFLADDLRGLDDEARAKALAGLEDGCRSELWDAEGERWVADYRRLRFVARKR